MKQRPKTPYKESMKQKADSLKKIDKINKPLANLIKMRREKTEISKVRHEKVEITTPKKSRESQRLL
jgi:hypothetical protein